MACKQGIRRGPVDRHGHPIVTQETTTKKEDLTTTSNKHSDLHDEVLSHISITTGRMTDGDAFLIQLRELRDLRKKVTDLILKGNINAIDKHDLEPLIQLWLKGLDVKNELTSSPLGPSFAVEFKNLSTILTAARVDLEGLSAKATSPMLHQESPRSPGRIHKSNKRWVLPVIISGFLGLAIILDNMDYSFYVLLRFAVCASFGWWAWSAHGRGHSTWRNIFTLTAVFYNPFVPLRLEKDWWQVINSLTIGGIILASAKNKLGLSGERTRPTE